MKKLQAFCVDLDKKLEVLDFSGDELAADLLYYDVKKASDLSNWTRRVFATEAEAEAFLSEYKKTLKSLNNKKDCKDRNFKNVLVKRRYIVLAKMKIKKFTVRNRDLKLQKNDLFNLYDQTHFLSVQCTKIECVDNVFMYHYKLIE